MYFQTCPFSFYAVNWLDSVSELKTKQNKKNPPFPPPPQKKPNNFLLEILFEMAHFLLKTNYVHLLTSVRTYEKVLTFQRYFTRTNEIVGYTKTEV